MQKFTEKENRLIEKLDTPTKVQDFLNKLRFNFEPLGDTIKSPLFTLRHKNAHCIEGALLGAYILSKHGYKPYLLHLKAVKRDLDHVIAPFKEGKYWGALSKTNHAVLRYREPVYKNIRELAMSYFHEYFLDDGEKTLRQYSALLPMSRFEKDWPTSPHFLWGVDEELDKIKHFDIVPKTRLKKLRKADQIEIKAGKIVEYRNEK